MSARIISECVDALETYHAVDVAIPSADTIIEVDEDDMHHATSRRAPRCAAARPRRRSAPRTIREAYEIAGEDPDFEATDDCTRRAALPARRADLGGRTATSAT